MASKRWLAPWANSATKPAIYHCISRVVDRKFVLGDEEREHFRMLMRMYENFSGCRVLSYCLMSNHFHILLEVPTMPTDGISDDELLVRLAAIKNEAFVAGVAAELATAKAEPDAEYAAIRLGEIRERFTYRMHNLSEFMKTLLQRFTRWFNRIHQRCGTLWEERYKSVIVESGLAARTIAAYIDLNPVRAGLVADPADYRWSSYGEAIGGGRKGNGKKARLGLIRVFEDPTAANFALAQTWQDVSRRHRRLMGLALERKPGHAPVAKSGQTRAAPTAAETHKNSDNRSIFSELSMVDMLRCRIRYFTDGAVIGSQAFVNEAFAEARERFPEKRKDGARRLRGNAAAAAGTLWSMRDLRLRIS
jgi:putative transposase